MCAVPARQRHALRAPRVHRAALDGGFSEYVLVRERSVIKLPEGLAPDEVVPHADAGLTAYHAVAKVAHLMPPGRPRSSCASGRRAHRCPAARELGSGTVAAIDTQPERLSLAREPGLDQTVERGSESVDGVRELTDGHGADLVIRLRRNRRYHRDSLAMLARGGTYSVVGYGGTVAPQTRSSARARRHRRPRGQLDRPVRADPAARGGRLTLRVEKHPLDAVNDVLDSLRGGRSSVAPCSCPDRSRR